MRVSGGAYFRSFWYDRSLDDVSIRYANSSVSPHAGVLRASYTVPANKKARITGFDADIRRVTSATTLDTLAAYIKKTPSGGSAVDFLMLAYKSNVLSEQWGGTRVLVLDINEGDKVGIYTLDNSIGGTVNYVLNLYINQYDA